MKAVCSAYSQSVKIYTSIWRSCKKARGFKGIFKYIGRLAVEILIQPQPFCQVKRLTSGHIFSFK